LRFGLLQSLVEQVITANLGGERADRALATVLRTHRDLSSEERKHVAEWSLGLALWRGRMDRLAQGNQALWFPLFLADRVKWPVDAVAAATHVDAQALRNALDTAAPSDPAEHVSFEYSLPNWLARRWVHQLGVVRAARLASAMNERGPISIRVNTLRVTREELMSRLAGEGVSARTSSLVDTGLRLDGRPNIVALPSWREGLFEVQDEGSQLIAEAVSAQPGETVIDLCAGAGGKTLALAAAMQNKGHLIAIEPDAQRLADLSVRLKRAGVACVEPRRGDARDPSTWSDVHGQADAVLVDAPCSSLGTLRRGPDARWRLAADEPERWAELQWELVRAASQLVRPGGRLVYATCSIDPAENEAVAQRAVESLPVKLEREHRTWPDIDGCDGFFWSVFSSVRTS
jgi:16S rRNA (cytosine967-C5)-methyltransferase